MNAMHGRTDVLKRLALYALALVLFALGLVGLLLPLLPGVFFLLAAVICLSLASPSLAERWNRHPALARWHRRWRASAGLPGWQRGRLAFWLTADAALETLRRSPERRRWAGPR